MPKKSNEQPNIIPLPRANNRLRPPPPLSPAERNLFVELVAANPPEHFRGSDLPLLAQYCAALVLAEQAVAELRQAPLTPAGKASPWLIVFEKANRATVALSLRLRLSPQARAPNPTKRKAPNLSHY